MAATDGSGNAYLSKNDGDDILLLKMWKDSHVSIDHSVDSGTTWTGKKVATGVIDYGNVSVAVGGGTATKFSVAFSEKFTQIPSVTVTASTSSPQTHAVSVLSVTKTGFEGYVYREASQQQIVVRWIAVGQ